MQTNHEIVIQELLAAGFEPTKDRAYAVHQVNLGRCALALHSDQYLTPTFIESISKITDKEILTVDFNDLPTQADLEKLTGIVDWDPTAWSQSGKYLIARNFDTFLTSSFVDNLETDQKLGNMVKLLRTIQKYGHGVMLGFGKNKTFEDVMDPVSEAYDAHGTGSSSYYLWELMMECLEDKVLGREIENERNE
ncbi:hypothetical protein KBD69_02995 [Candidatus Woesebacteria bacterium]|nr:hypothetical protein [Candidatus Woesebacteria bacterium]